MPYQNLLCYHPHLKSNIIDVYSDGQIRQNRMGVNGKQRNHQANQKSFIELKVKDGEYRLSKKYDFSFSADT